MDKIKEILVYRFWILLAIALIAPVVGWYVGKGAVSREITRRKREIKSAFDGIPSGELPNQKWVDGVKKVNDQQQVQINKAWVELARDQNLLKTWPPALAEYMAQLGPDDEMDKPQREHYAALYLDEWLELWHLINPLRDGEYNPVTDKYKDVGIVSFDPALMPIKKWGFDAPSTKQIRSAQEDVWMYRSLLEAIAQVNNDPENLSDAVITDIKELRFLFGLQHNPTLNALLDGTATVADTPAGTSTVPTTGSPGTVSNRRGGFTRGDEEDEAVGQAGNHKALEMASPRVRFERLFRGEERAGGTGGSGGGFGGGRDDDEDENPSQLGDFSKGRRYLEETTQYKVRGFNMKVVMDHRRLPDLLSALSNSPWPVQILRVDQVDSAILGRGMGGQGFSRQGNYGPSRGNYRPSGVRTGGVPNDYLATVSITGSMQIYEDPHARPAPAAAGVGLVAGEPAVLPKPKGTGVPQSSPRTAELHSNPQNLEDFKKMIGGSAGRRGGGRGFSRGRDDEDE